jgi:hypothetical protein
VHAVLPEPVNFLDGRAFNLVYSELVVLAGPMTRGGGTVRELAHDVGFFGWEARRGASRGRRWRHQIACDFSVQISS